AGLYRGGFFDRAAFYGRTCLRIFYGLSRFRELLTQKIRSLDISLAVDDISRFVQDVKPLKIWSREYFMQLADRMKIIEA
ncbi:MAG: hypothetical protein WCH30_07615, partial [Chlorobiaceae bacterium]